MMSPDLKPWTHRPASRVTDPAGDRIFSNLTRVRGSSSLLIMASIGAFLVWKAVPAFQNNTGDFFTTQQWFLTPIRRSSGLLHWLSGRPFPQ